MRQATTTDFKVGTTLVNKYGEWTIIKHYTETVWELRGKQGTICVGTADARFYQVK